MANCKCWDLATGEKPAIKKQHNNIQPYHTKTADFASLHRLALRFMVMIGVLRHYRIIGNSWCIAASSVNIPGEITPGELTEGSMMGCINRLKEKKKVPLLHYLLAVYRWAGHLTKLHFVQSWFLWVQEGFDGVYMSLFFFFPVHPFSCLSFPIRTRSPGCCSRSVVKTTAHSGSAWVSVCLSDCSRPSIIIGLVLSHTKILCWVNAVFGSIYTTGHDAQFRFVAYVWLFGLCAYICF